MSKFLTNLAERIRRDAAQREKEEQRKIVKNLMEQQQAEELSVWKIIGMFLIISVVMGIGILLLCYVSQFRSM